MFIDKIDLTEFSEEEQELIKKLDESFDRYNQSAKALKESIRRRDEKLGNLEDATKKVIETIIETFGT